MARKQVTNMYPVDDGEVEITLTSLGGMDGTALGLRIGEMLGPAIGTLVSALDNKDAHGVGDAFKVLFEKVNPTQFKSIAKQVLAGAQIQMDGEFHDLTMERIDNVFSGNVSALYKLVFDAVKLNFANFSQGLGLNTEIVSKLTTMMKARALKSIQEQSEVKTPPTVSPPVAGV